MSACCCINFDLFSARAAETFKFPYVNTFCLVTTLYVGCYVIAFFQLLYGSFVIWYPILVLTRYNHFKQWEASDPTYRAVVISSIVCVVTCVIMMASGLTLVIAMKKQDDELVNDWVIVTVCFCCLLFVLVIARICLYLWEYDTFFFVETILLFILHCYFYLVGKSFLDS